MRPLSGLELDYLPAAGPEPVPWAEVLGVASFGGGRELAPQAGGNGIPSIAIQTPVLDSQPSVREVWRAPPPLTSGQRGPVRYRCSARTLFGCISLAESASTPGSDREGSGHSALQSATARAYRAILAAIDAAGYPHLLRVWNYMAQINGETHGLERYRQFNQARREALADCGRDLSGNVPAACALGSAPGSPLAVYFLAGREAPTAIENPRQINAYDYPPEYGPRPTFSRASLLREADAVRLFISGTASIAGHQSVHREDPAAQTRESLTNIEAVLGEANRLCRGARFTLDSLAYKVYVRHRAHLPTVKTILRSALGASTQVAYLWADICRHDLLVEIEATGQARGAALSSRS